MWRYVVRDVKWGAMRDVVWHNVDKIARRFTSNHISGTAQHSTPHIIPHISNTTRSHITWCGDVEQCGVWNLV